MSSSGKFDYGHYDSEQSHSLATSEISDYGSVIRQGQDPAKDNVQASLVEEDSQLREQMGRTTSLGTDNMTFIALIGLLIIALTSLSL